MLTSSGRLATMVRIANYEQPSYEEYIEKQKTKKKIDKIKLDEAKIYLVTDKQKEAESIASIGTTSIWKPTLISIATIVILAILFILMPEILELINSSIGRN